MNNLKREAFFQQLEVSEKKQSLFPTTPKPPGLRRTIRVLHRPDTVLRVALP